MNLKTNWANFIFNLEMIRIFYPIEYLQTAIRLIVHLIKFTNSNLIRKISLMHNDGVYIVNRATRVHLKYGFNLLNQKKI